MAFKVVKEHQAVLLQDVLFSVNTAGNAACQHKEKLQLSVDVPVCYNAFPICFFLCPQAVFHIDPSFFCVVIRPLRQYFCTKWQLFLCDICYDKPARIRQEYLRPGMEAGAPLICLKRCVFRRLPVSIL